MGASLPHTRLTTTAHLTLQFYLLHRVSAAEQSPIVVLLSQKLCASIGEPPARAQHECVPTGCRSQQALLHASAAEPAPERHLGARWLAAAAATAGAACALAAAPPVAGAASARESSRAEALTLYQYEVCPWCNKVKAALDYRGVPYRAVEVHPLFKGELSWSTYKKVPLVVLPNGDSLTESSKIVDFVYEQYGEPTPAAKRGCASLASSLAAACTRPGADVLVLSCSAWCRRWVMRCRLFARKREDADAGAAELAEEAAWRAWADERLVKVLTANLYASMRESYQAMDYIMDIEAFSYFSQISGYSAGGLVMWLVGRGLPAKYGLERDNLRGELLALVHELAAAGTPPTPPSRAFW